MNPDYSKMDCAGYWVTKRGTFGTGKRFFTNDEGQTVVVIQWGPMQWLSAVQITDAHRLKSAHEHEARAEATLWLESLDT